jgi:hypothetical protein
MGGSSEDPASAVFLRAAICCSLLPSYLIHLISPVVSGR